MLVGADLDGSDFGVEVCDAGVATALLDGVPAGVAVVVSFRVGEDDDRLLVVGDDVELVSRCVFLVLSLSLVWCFFLFDAF